MLLGCARGGRELVLREAMMVAMPQVGDDACTEPFDRRTHAVGPRDRGQQHDVAAVDRGKRQHRAVGSRDEVLRRVAAREHRQRVILRERANATSTRIDLLRIERVRTREQHEVRTPEPRMALAQVAGRQALAVRERQQSVETDEIEIAKQTPMLEPVVEHDHRSALLHEPRGAGHAIGILLLQQPRQSPLQHRALVVERSARRAAVAAREHGRPFAARA